jgi:hypothetical protein
MRKVRLYCSFSKDFCCKYRKRTDVACSVELPLSLSQVVLLCAQQLADYNVLGMIRTSPARAKFAERAPRLE